MVIFHENPIATSGEIRSEKTFSTLRKMKHFSGAWQAHGETLEFADRSAKTRFHFLTSAGCSPNITLGGKSGEVAQATLRCFVESVT
jgi:hypothetical protein